MKRTLLCLAVSGAMLGVVSSASALTNIANTYYMPIEVGVYHTDATRNMNNSGVGTIGFGYNLSPVLAVQANAGMMNPASSSANQNTNGYLADVEAKASLPTQTSIMPYALLGVGYMQLVSRNPMTDAGLGLTYALGPDLNANATYRMMYQFGQNKLDSTATVGLSFNFGAIRSLPSMASTNTNTLTAQQQAMLANAQKPLSTLLPNGVTVCQNGQMSPNQAGCVTFSGNVMTMHLNVKFDQNLAVIRPEFYGPIARLGNFMSAYPNTSAVLYGYASSEGPLAFNQALSTKRAVMVQNYLVNVKHIDISRVSVKGMGISNPIASNATESGRMLNRRVEADVPVPVQITN